MNDNKGKKDPGMQKFNFNNKSTMLIILFVIIAFLFFFVFQDSDFSEDRPYSTFLTYLETGKINSISILDSQIIKFTVNDSMNEIVTFKTLIPYYDDDLMKKILESGVLVEGASQSMSPIRILFDFLPWIVLFFIVWFMFRQVQGSGNKAFSFGKSKAKRYINKDTKTKFSDVAGQEEAKYELQEVVEFLKTPEKFSKIGAKIPKGVLLVGLPGTGKTMLAKAIAGEADVPFFHMSGSDFVEMFVGVGASRVRDLFEQGRKNAPCIIFIDELDAVGRVRGAGYGGGHDEREQTLNQMLVEMDGFDTKAGVIILAATNRPDVLDPALLRPGRFDRQITIDMPDIKEREAILKIHSNKIHIAIDVDMSIIARATPGTSGADLANLVNEAALHAVRKNKNKVEMEDFEEARDKILMGIARRSKVIPKKEKEMTAYHEAGHTLLHYFLENADPLHKVTIIPHGQVGGVTFSLPENDARYKSEGWLKDRITIGMGGYAAELLVYGENTTGSRTDIEQSTSIARKMICEWGMSENLGPISYGQKEEPIFIGKEIARHKDYSEETAQKIDEEIKTLVQGCLNKANEILNDNRDKLELLANALIEKETLDDKEIQGLLKIKPKNINKDEFSN